MPVRTVDVLFLFPMVGGDSMSSDSSETPSRRARPVPADEGAPLPGVYVEREGVDDLWSRFEKNERTCVALWRGWRARDSRGPFRVVEGYSHVQAMMGGGLDELSIRRAVDARRDSEEQNGPPLGWVVADRGSEGRPDEEMLRVHLSLFNLDYQVLAVFDPETRDVGWYASEPADERVANLPFRSFERASTGAAREEST